jgi:hypothetical protein
MLFRPSQLDSSVTVIEVEEGDKGPVVDALETRGHGYTFLGSDQKLVVVDRRILAAGMTRHHLLAVEAHEIGHIRRGADEREADLEGIRILSQQKKHMAARLLRARL